MSIVSLLVLARDLTSRKNVQYVEAYISSPSSLYIKMLGKNMALLQDWILNYHRLGEDTVQRLVYASHDKIVFGG